MANRGLGWSGRLEEDHALCMEMLMGLTIWVRQLVETVEDMVLRDAAGRLAIF